MFLESVVYIIPQNKHISSTTYLVYVVAVADVTIVVAVVGNVADGRRVAHGDTILHTTLRANLSQIFLTLKWSFQRLLNFIFRLFLFFWPKKSLPSFNDNAARGCSWSDVWVALPGAPMVARGQGGPWPTCHSSGQSKVSRQHVKLILISRFFLWFSFPD